MNLISLKPLYTLIDEVLKRPVMFNVEGVMDLKVLLLGYSIGVNSNEDNELEDFGGFTEFVAKEFEITSTHGWAEIISFYSSDRRHSLELFQSTLEKYKESKK